jgi:N-methylhydantoinase B/oxoprolinase/acetone carboxylase alpha subunit
MPGYGLPVRMFYAPIRAAVPASGLFGGREGTIDVPIWNGERVGADSDIRRDGWVMFRDDADELTFHVASGGGYGDPSRRDPAAVEADIRAGLLTREGAERDYGCRPPRAP